jgi:hypothetical protein
VEYFAIDYPVRTMDRRRLISILTRKGITKIEEYYYWLGFKEWYPFTEELKKYL